MKEVSVVAWSSFLCDADHFTFGRTFPRSSPIPEGWSGLVLVPGHPAGSLSSCIEKYHQLL